MCVINPLGDLLISMDNKMDVIKSFEYIPPGIQAITDCASHEIQNVQDLEPIPFDDNYNILSDYKRSLINHYQFIRDFGTGHAKPSKNIRYMNFVRPNEMTHKGLVTNPWLNKSGYTWKSNYKETIDEYRCTSLLNRLQVLMEQRSKILKSAKYRLELEMLHQDKMDNILYEEYQKYSKFKALKDKYEQTISKRNFGTIDIADINEENNYNNSLLSTIKSKGSKNSVDLFNFLHSVDPEIYDMPIIDQFRPMTPDSELLPITQSDSAALKSKECIHEKDNVAIPTNVVEPVILPKIQRVKKNLGIQLAPDGQIANSTIGKIILDWSSKHNKFQALAGQNVRKVLKKTNTLTKDLIVDENDALKSKWKKMMDDKVKEKEVEEVCLEGETGSELELKKNVKDGKDSTEEDKVVETIKKEIPILDHGIGFRARREKVKDVVPQLDSYPKLIEQAITYNWMPLDEVKFYIQRPNLSYIIVKIDFLSFITNRVYHTSKIKLKKA
jgi:uncharacterized cupredoxin-like copper-binding protein